MMTNAANIHSCCVREILLVLCCALLSGSTYGQTVSGQPTRGIYEANNANVAHAIAKLKSGDFAGADVDMIRRGKAVQAIPILKEQFTRIHDPLEKAQIASALIKLGDNDETYWDFLAKLEASVIDAPDFWSPALLRNLSHG